MVKNPPGSPFVILKVIVELGPMLSASDASRGGVVMTAVPCGAFSVRVAA